LNKACLSQATAGTKLVRITKKVMSLSSFSLEFYDISPFHSSIWLDQSFDHCPKFLTAGDLKNRMAILS